MELLKIQHGEKENLISKEINQYQAQKELIQAMIENKRSGNTFTHETDKKPHDMLKDSDCPICFEELGQGEGEKSLVFQCVNRREKIIDSLPTSYLNINRYNCKYFNCLPLLGCLEGLGMVLVPGTLYLVPCTWYLVPGTLLRMKY